MSYRPREGLKLLVIMLVAVAVSLLLTGRKSSKPGAGSLRLSRPAFATPSSAILVMFGAGVLAIAVKGNLLINASLYGEFAAPRPVVSLAQIGLLVGCLAAGVVSVRYPWIAAVGFIGLALILFGYGTRALAILPLAFVFGRAVMKPMRFRALAAGCLVSVLLLPLPLHMRSLTQHGIEPYSAELAHSPVATYESGTVQVLANVGFTFAIADYVDQVPPSRGVPAEALIASINPMPARIAGWDTWEPRLRANYYVPYSFIGEWRTTGALGLLFATLVWLCGVSWSIAFASNWARRSRAGLAAAMLTIGLGVLGSLYILQYNTRGVSRLFGLIIILGIVSSFGAKYRADGHRALSRLEVRRD